MIYYLNRLFLFQILTIKLNLLKSTRVVFDTLENLVSTDLVSVSEVKQCKPIRGQILQKCAIDESTASDSELLEASYLTDLF